MQRNRGLLSRNIYDHDEYAINKQFGRAERHGSDRVIGRIAAGLMSKPVAYRLDRETVYRKAGVQSGFLPAVGRIDAACKQCITDN